MKEKYVQIGRVCLINFGHLANKLCTIIDVVDANRVLIDGPEKITGVPRQVIPLCRLSLTKLHVKIPHSCKRSVLRKEFEKENIMEQWKKTSWAAKLEKREKRAAMNDFDRFKVMVARVKVGSVIRSNLGAALKKERKEKAAAQKK